MECCYFDSEQLLAEPGCIVVLVVAIFLALLALTLLIIKAVIYCKIFHKAGYCWALGLLMLVPIACIIMPFVLAFGRWPIERKLEQLRQQQEGGSP
jgi:uncharacterized membrane protein YhaH (DUF805 family)